MHAVICEITGRFLCISNYVNTVNQLSKIPNTHVWYNLKHVVPKYINLNKPFNYVYDGISNSFKVRMVEQHSEEYDKYYMFGERAAAIDVLNITVNSQISLIERNLIDLDQYNEASQCDLTEDKDACYIVNSYKLTRARVKQLTEFRIRYSDIFLNVDNLQNLNNMFDECNREMHVYGNF
jgi:hypothetical protein